MNGFAYDDAVNAPAIVVLSTNNPDAFKAAFRRYEGEYRVCHVATADERNQLADEIKETGTPVALFALDTDLPATELDELIGETRRVVPTSRRLLVAPFDRFWADSTTHRSAVANGIVDALLLLPQGQRDEEFQSAVGELLNEWNATIATPEVVAIEVVSPERDHVTQHLLDYAGRIGMPARHVFPDSPEGQRVLAQAEQDRGKWPIVGTRLG